MKARVTLAALLAAAASAAPAAQAALPSPISFGRSGGNIRPFTVTIGASGRVSATAATVTRTRVSARTLARLERLAAALPAGRRACPGTLPDVAALFVRVGPRTASVHGACSAAFESAYAALAAAVGLRP